MLLSLLLFYLIDLSSFLPPLYTAREMRSCKSSMVSVSPIGLSKGLNGIKLSLTVIGLDKTLSIVFH